MNGGSHFMLENQVIDWKLKYIIHQATSDKLILSNNNKTATSR